MLASLLASIALGIINPTLASGALMGSMTGFAQDNINFVRSNEKEADSIGIDMLMKSGLDPRGMAGFFKKMQQNMRYYYMDNIPAILRTHPLDEERIAEAENRSEGMVRRSYPDNINYRLFKELIRVNVVNDEHQLWVDYKKCPKETPAIACQYGASLTELNMNQPKQALARISELAQEEPNNLFFAITKAHAEVANQEAGLAVSQLASLQQHSPDNYALLREYSYTLLQANKPDQAVSVLLKGRQQFKHDLSLCNQLAQAEADAHHTGYAYFTLAECHMLQGESRDAIQKLKTAKKLWPNDHILQAKIAAKIDEIKSMMSQ
jgi:predicted Zn-dependent protease